MPLGIRFGSSTTAAATTGPASGPRPASSQPATGQTPRLISARSRRKLGGATAITPLGSLLLPSGFVPNHGRDRAQAEPAQPEPGYSRYSVATVRYARAVFTDLDAGRDHDFPGMMSDRRNSRNSRRNRLCAASTATRLEIAKSSTDDFLDAAFQASVMPRKSGRGFRQRDVRRAIPRKKPITVRRFEEGDGFARSCSFRESQLRKTRCSRIC